MELGVLFLFSNDIGHPWCHKGKSILFSPQKILWHTKIGAVIRLCWCFSPTKIGSVEKPGDWIILVSDQESNKRPWISGLFSPGFFERPSFQKIYTPPGYHLNSADQPHNHRLQWSHMFYFPIQMANTYSQLYPHLVFAKRACLFKPKYLFKPITWRTYGAWCPVFIL